MLSKPPLRKDQWPVLYKGQVQTPFEDPELRSINSGGGRNEGVKPVGGRRRVVGGAKMVVGNHRAPPSRPYLAGLGAGEWVLSQLIQVRG